jgi:hypothetical protein
MCAHIPLGPLHIWFDVRNIQKRPSCNRRTESGYILSKYILLGRCVKRDWRIRKVREWQKIRTSDQWENGVRAYLVKGDRDI